MTDKPTTREEVVKTIAATLDAEPFDQVQLGYSMMQKRRDVARKLATRSITALEQAGLDPLKLSAELEQVKKERDEEMREHDEELGRECAAWTEEIERRKAAEAKVGRFGTALREIKALKPTKVADGFMTGPQALLNAAQRIARAALKETGE